MSCLDTYVKAQKVNTDVLKRICGKTNPAEIVEKFGEAEEQEETVNDLTEKED